MDKKLELSMEMNREPMLAVKDGRILFANSAARGTFPAAQEGKYALNLIPEQILFTRNPNFIASAELDGTMYTIRVSDEDGVRFLLLSPRSEGQGHELLSNGLMTNLRGTLNNLGLSVERISALADPETQGAPMKQYLSILCHSYYSLKRQILNLDTVLRVQDRSLVLFPRQTDLVDLCAGVVDTLNALEAEGWAKLRFSSSLPALIACVNGQMVERLLLNLLSNSLAHTPPEGEITVVVSKSGENAILSVDDNGKGIPPETLRNIFARYECPLDAEHLDRAASAGLGLSVASGLAKLHGGTLIIESREGHGTSVRATLPLRQTAEVHGSDDIGPAGMGSILTELSGLLDYSYYTEKYLD